MHSFKQNNNLDDQRFVYFIGLGLMIFFARSIYTTIPEMDDALKKWEVAIELANTYDLTLFLSRDHHSSRWGVVASVALIIKFFGQTLTAYYLLCLSMYSVVFVSLIHIGREEIDHRLLIFLGILLFYEPMFSGPRPKSNLSFSGCSTSRYRYLP